MSVSLILLRTNNSQLLISCIRKVAKDTRRVVKDTLKVAKDTRNSQAMHCRKCRDTQALKLEVIRHPAAISNHMGRDPR